MRIAYLFKFVRELPMNMIVTDYLIEGSMESEDPGLILGRRILAILKDRGWTQKTLAEEMHSSQPSISRIISGHDWVSRETLLQLARVLKVHYRTLLDSGRENRVNHPSPPSLEDALRVVNANRHKLKVVRDKKSK